MTQHRILLQQSAQAGRQYNQDRFAVYQADDSSDLLIVVADGVGGTADGALAAQIIVDQAASCWQQRLSYPDGESLLQDLASRSNQSIQQQTEQGISTAATLVALLVLNNQVLSAHAGDSRLYQFNLQGNSTHTKDHSLAYAKFLMGEITEEQLATHPTQSQLLNCLNGSDDMQCDITPWQIDNGHYFVLCTDGFWEIFNKDEIAQLINNDNREFMFANRLDEQLQAHPKHDNTTVVICALEATTLINENTAEPAAEAITLPPVAKAREHLNRPPVPEVAEPDAVSKKGWWLALIAVFIVLIIVYSLGQYMQECCAMPPQPQLPVEQVEQVTEQDAALNSGTGDQTFVAQPQETDRQTAAGDESEDRGTAKALNDNLQPGPMIELDVAAGEDATAKLEQQLSSNGDIAAGSKLDKTGVLVDQYAEITTVQLTVKNTPVFGAIVKYKKTPDGIKVISGKVSNLPDVADAPTHDFASCFSRYQQAQLALGKTVLPGKSAATLYIDAASSGYFWLTDIQIKEDGSNYQLSLLDATCDALRLISSHVSG